MVSAEGPKRVRMCVTVRGRNVFVVAVMRSAPAMTGGAAALVMGARTDGHRRNECWSEWNEWSGFVAGER